MADSVRITLSLDALRQWDGKQRGGRQRIRALVVTQHRPQRREKQPAQGCGAGSRLDDGDGGGNAGWRAGEWSRRGAPVFPATTGGGRPTDRRCSNRVAESGRRSSSAAYNRGRWRWPARQGGLERGPGRWEQRRRYGAPAAAVARKLGPTATGSRLVAPGPHGRTAV